MAHRGFRCAIVGLATATLLLTGAPAAVAAPRYTVSASASAGSAEAGQSVRLTGKVSPRARGERVRVQRRATTGWTTVARPQLNRHGRYSTLVRVPAAGPNLYRVVKPRSHGHRKGTSPAVTVTGWGWRPLASLPVMDTSGSPTLLGSVAHHDLRFGPSLLFPPFSGFVYRVDGRCDAFDAHIWATDDSPFAPSTVSLGGHVIGDTMNSGVTAQATVYVAGRTEPAHLYRGAGLIARFDQISVGGTVTGYTVIWGGARVHCRF